MVVESHVTEPSGNEIDYRNMRNSRTGGYLDVMLLQPGRFFSSLLNWELSIRVNKFGY